MSPVTRLARLPGPILLSVHMGNFSPVDRDEIQETKPRLKMVEQYIIITSLSAVVALWALVPL